MGAISAACVVALAAAWLAIWIRDNRPAPHRTREQAADDVARYRADRLTQQTIADREACEAIWNLTATARHRKEND